MVELSNEAQELLEKEIDSSSEPEAEPENNAV